MIAESIEKLSNIRPSDNSFPGLRPFELHESYLFFGREGQSEKMLKKLEATHFLAVVGTSGSGKSSLVRAGLVSSLLGGMMPSAGSNWRVAVMRPSNDPVGNLARALSSPEVFGSEDKENAELQTQIAEATLRRGNLGLVEAVRLALQTVDENLLVIVDQFEELFRFAREAKSTRYENDAAAFVKLLLEPSQQYHLAQEELGRKLRAIERELKQKRLTEEQARSESAAVREEVRRRDVRIYVVLTMRSDFLGDCAKFWDLPEAINESQYLIPRLTRGQLREAIAGPVAVGKGDITARLVNQLLNDIGDNQDQLPVLQHALMRTWDEWRRPRHDHRARPVEIDVCCYEAIGGMKEALSRHADEALNEVITPDRKIVEKIFKALTEKGEDNRVIRRPTTIEELSAVVETNEGDVKAIIEIFRRQGRSFLLPPAGMPLHSKTLIDISHESLIRGWKQLQQWVSEEAESVSLYRRLFQPAKLNKIGKSELWHGVDLQVGLEWQKTTCPVEAWAKRYSPTGDYTEYIPSAFEMAIAFLLASQERNIQERREQARREQEEEERKKRELEQAQALIELEKRVKDTNELVIFAELGQSAYEITHRLGNDLGLVRTYVNNIRDFLADEGVSSTVIETELDKILSDVGRVLSMSKGVKGRISGLYNADEFTTKTEEITVEYLLDKAKLGLPASPANTDIQWDVGESIGMVRVVTGQVINILTTLVTNAIEAMPDGGRITIKAFKSGGDVCIEVADNGPGISTATQKKIFRLFFSTKNSSGFGLWSARRYANANGGDLTINSALGKGATFTLKLPLSIPERNVRDGSFNENNLV